MKFVHGLCIWPINRKSSTDIANIVLESSWRRTHRKLSLFKCWYPFWRMWEKVILCNNSKPIEPPNGSKKSYRGVYVFVFPVTILHSLNESWVRINRGFMHIGIDNVHVLCRQWCPKAIHNNKSDDLLYAVRNWKQLGSKWIKWCIKLQSSEHRDFLRTASWS